MASPQSAPWLFIGVRKLAVPSCCHLSTWCTSLPSSLTTLRLEVLLVVPTDRGSRRRRGQRESRFERGWEAIEISHIQTHIRRVEILLLRLGYGLGVAETPSSPSHHIANDDVSLLLCAASIALAIDLLRLRNCFCSHGPFVARKDRQCSFAVPVDLTSLEYIPPYQCMKVPLGQLKHHMYVIHFIWSELFSFSPLLYGRITTDHGAMKSSRSGAPGHGTSDSSMQCFYLFVR